MKTMLLSALKITMPIVSLVKKQRIHHYVTVKLRVDIAEEKNMVKYVKLTMIVT